MAAANPFGQDTFYQPGSLYGASQSWQSTPVSQMIEQQDHPTAFSLYGNSIGVGDNDTPFSRWFYSQYPRYDRGYSQALTTNPNLLIGDYNATLPTLAGLLRIFQGQYTPAQRGIQQAQYAPDARWIAR